jgi:hypothetical protein
LRSRPPQAFYSTVFPIAKPVQVQTERRASSSIKQCSVASGILPAVEPSCQPGGTILEQRAARERTFSALNRRTTSPGGKMPPSTAAKDGGRYRRPVFAKPPLGGRRATQKQCRWKGGERRCRRSATQTRCVGPSRLSNRSGRAGTFGRCCGQECPRSGVRGPRAFQPAATSNRPSTTEQLRPFFWSANAIRMRATLFLL